MSAGLGDFDVALGAEDDVDVVTEALDEAGFIGGVDAIGFGAGEGFFQELGRKSLGSLREDHAFARNGAGDERHIFREAGALYFFDGVHRGNAEDGGVAFAGFFDDAGDLLDGDKGADGVVDENDFGVGGDFAQGLSDGVLAGIAAADYADKLI